MSSPKLQTMEELTPEPKTIEELTEPTSIALPDKDKNIIHQEAYKECVGDPEHDDMMLLIDCIDKVRY